MKKLMMMTLMISSLNSFADQSVEIDPTTVLSIETHGRELIYAGDINNKKPEGISISSGVMNIKFPSEVSNIEFKDGSVQTLQDIANQHGISKMSGGQDGGGG